MGMRERGSVRLGKIEKEKYENGEREEE